MPEKYRLSESENEKWRADLADVQRTDRYGKRWSYIQLAREYLQVSEGPKYDGEEPRGDDEEETEYELEKAKKEKTLSGHIAEFMKGKERGLKYFLLHDKRLVALTKALQCEDGKLGQLWADLKARPSSEGRTILLPGFEDYGPVSWSSGFVVPCWTRADGQPVSHKWLAAWLKSGKEGRDKRHLIIEAGRGSGLSTAVEQILAWAEEDGWEAHKWSAGALPAPKMQSLLVLDCVRSFPAPEQLQAWAAMPAHLVVVCGSMERMSLELIKPYQSIRINPIDDRWLQELQDKVAKSLALNPRKERIPFDEALRELVSLIPEPTPPVVGALFRYLLEKGTTRKILEHLDKPESRTDIIRVLLERSLSKKGHSDAARLATATKRVLDGQKVIAIELIAGVEHARLEELLSQRVAEDIRQLVKSLEISEKKKNELLGYLPDFSSDAILDGLLATGLVIKRHRTYESPLAPLLHRFIAEEAMNDQRLLQRELVTGMWRTLYEVAELPGGRKKLTNALLGLSAGELASALCDLQNASRWICHVDWTKPQLVARFIAVFYCAGKSMFESPDPDRLRKVFTVLKPDVQHPYFLWLAMLPDNQLPPSGCALPDIGSIESEIAWFRSGLGLGDELVGLDAQCKWDFDVGQRASSAQQAPLPLEFVRAMIVPNEEDLKQQGLWDFAWAARAVPERWRSFVQETAWGRRRLCDPVKSSDARRAMGLYGQFEKELKAHCRGNLDFEKRIKSQLDPVRRLFDLWPEAMLRLFKQDEEAAKQVLESTLRWLIRRQEEHLEMDDGPQKREIEMQIRGFGSFVCTHGKPGKQLYRTIRKLTRDKETMTKLLTTSKGLAPFWKCYAAVVPEELFRLVEKIKTGEIATEGHHGKPLPWELSRWLCLDWGPKRAFKEGIVSNRSEAGKLAVWGEWLDKPAHREQLWDHCRGLEETDVVWEILGHLALKSSLKHGYSKEKLPKWSDTGKGVIQKAIKQIPATPLSVKHWCLLVDAGIGSELDAELLFLALDWPRLDEGVEHRDSTFADSLTGKDHYSAADKSAALARLLQTLYVLDKERTLNWLLSNLERRPEVLDKVELSDVLVDCGVPFTSLNEALVQRMAAGPCGQGLIPAMLKNSDEAQNATWLKHEHTRAIYFTLMVERGDQAFVEALSSMGECPSAAVCQDMMNVLFPKKVSKSINGCELLEKSCCNWSKEEQQRLWQEVATWSTAKMRTGLAKRAWRRSVAS